MPTSINCWERVNEATYVKWLLVHSKNSLRAMIITVILIFYHNDSKNERHHCCLGQVYSTFLHRVWSNIQLSSSIYKTPRIFDWANALLKSYHIVCLFWSYWMSIDGIAGKQQNQVTWILCSRSLQYCILLQKYFCGSLATIKFISRTSLFRSLVTAKCHRENHLFCCHLYCHFWYWDLKGQSDSAFLVRSPCWSCRFSKQF